MFVYLCLHYLFIRALDLRKRTSTGTRFNLNFSRVFRKKKTSQKPSFYFLSLKKLARLFIRKEVKPSPDGKSWNFIHLITCSRHQQTTFALKLVVEWRRLSRFPAQMTLVHAWAILVLRKFVTRSRPRLSILKLSIHCKGRTPRLLHGFVYISSDSLSAFLHVGWLLLRCWVVVFVLACGCWVGVYMCVRACLSGTLFGEDDTIIFHVFTGIPPWVAVDSS